MKSQVTICRICGSTDTRFLWNDSDGFEWFRCEACGSDTSKAEYAHSRYGASYITDLEYGEGPSVWQARQNHIHNVEMIERHSTGNSAGRLFLDVGCGAGTTMDVMRSRSWAVVGWDVTAEDRPMGVVVSPSFSASLFAHKFDAVLCREVLEHCPDPHTLLRELHAAVASEGVVEITTPRPLKLEQGPLWLCYHWAHLSVWHPDALRKEVEKIGFEIVETDLWDLGQRHVMRPVSGNNAN